MPSARRTARARPRGARRGRRRQSRRREPGRAVGRHDQHDPLPLGRRARHRARRSAAPRRRGARARTPASAHRLAHHAAHPARPRATCCIATAPAPSVDGPDALGCRRDVRGSAVGRPRDRGSAGAAAGRRSGRAGSRSHRDRPRPPTAVASRRGAPRRARVADVRIVHISDCYPPRLGWDRDPGARARRAPGAAGHDVHVDHRDARRRRSATAPSSSTASRCTAPPLGMPADLPGAPARHPRDPRPARARGRGRGRRRRARPRRRRLAVRLPGRARGPQARPAHRAHDPRRVGRGVPARPRGSPRPAHDWAEWGVVLTAVSATPRPTRSARSSGPDVPGEPGAQRHRRRRAGACRTSRATRTRCASSPSCAWRPRKRAMPLVQMAHERAPHRCPRDAAAPHHRRQRPGHRPGAAVRRPARPRLRPRSSSTSPAGSRPTRSRPTLAASDAFVAPAKLESFGIAALEARTAGLPVLAYAVHRHLAPSCTTRSRACSPRDDRAMVDAIARIASDDALRERDRRAQPQHRARAVVAARARRRRRGVRRGRAQQTAAPDAAAVRRARGAGDAAAAGSAAAAGAGAGAGAAAMLLLDAAGRCWMIGRGARNHPGKGGDSRKSSSGGRPGLASAS